jgi:hypothetical protein
MAAADSGYDDDDDDNQKLYNLSIDKEDLN